MKTLDVVTSQNVTIEYQLASIGERFVALLIDYLILLAYAVILYQIVLNTGPFSYRADENLEAVYQILLLPVLFFYQLTFEVFGAGQSPGKRAMSIKVVNLQGQNPNMGECFLRWAFRPIEIAFTLGSLAAI